MNSPLKILLVEDEFLIAIGLEYKLKQEKYEIVKIVPSGEKAVEFVHTQTPDLILMDIRLAGEIDGVEAAIQIRDFSSIPIIFMTGYSLSEIKNRVNSIRPLGYLAKPIIVSEVNSIINTHFS